MHPLDILRCFLLAHPRFHWLQHCCLDIPRMDTIDVDPIRRILQRRRFGEVRDSTFGSAVGGDQGLTNEAVDGGEIDDPAPVAGAVGLLGEELCGCVFRA